MMTDERGEIGLAIRRYRSALVSVGVLSAVHNILLLGGSLYMMMVYDSVLPSHSLPTLFGLLIMITIVYLFQGFFDQLRSRLLGDVANGLDRRLSPRVQRAMAERTLRSPAQTGDSLGPMRDLDQIRGFLSGSGPTTLIDIPWILFFLAILFLLHVYLGLTALIGALVLIALAFLTERAVRAPSEQLSSVAATRNGLAATGLRHVELLTALGMRQRMQDRWAGVNGDYQQAQHRMARAVGTLGGASRIFRLFLQSLILTVGALLVIDGQASGGVIFASSILSSRALAPVDQAIGNWRGFMAARLAWRRLNLFLQQAGQGDAARTVLPPPARELRVEQLFVGPPGHPAPTVQGVDFRLEAGSALAVVGPSAAGKTTLGRALIGLWRPVRGAVRLDGAGLDQWDSERLGVSIGYLPQLVELMEGKIAANIARLDPDAGSPAIIAAAKAAGVHDMIVAMPRGYDTPIGPDGGNLSAGQRQRIGLARALYGDPFLVLLDEPNANLDAEGDSALEQAIRGIRARGGIAVVIAHRPSAVAACDKALIMRDGRMEAFGPRDEVLARIMPPRLVPAMSVKG